MHAGQSQGAGAMFGHLHRRGCLVCTGLVLRKLASHAGHPKPSDIGVSVSGGNVSVEVETLGNASSVESSSLQSSQ